MGWGGAEGAATRTGCTHRAVAHASPRLSVSFVSFVVNPR